MSDKLNFRPDIRQKHFLERKQDIEILCGFWNNLELQYFDTLAAFKEHLVVFSPTFFAYALKVILQPRLNSKNW